MLEKKFKTKIGSGLVLFILVILGGVSFTDIYNHQYQIIFITGPLALVIACSLFSLSYTLTDKELRVNSFFFFHFSIPVSSIRKIEENWSFISAPAASTDRLEITYNKYDTLIISPKDKAGFTNALRSIHPSVEIKLKNKE